MARMTLDAWLYSTVERRAFIDGREIENVSFQDGGVWDGIPRALVMGLDERIALEDKYVLVDVEETADLPNGYPDDIQFDELAYEELDRQAREAHALHMLADDAAQNWQHMDVYEADRDASEQRELAALDAEQPYTSDELAALDNCPLCPAKRNPWYGQICSVCSWRWTEENSEASDEE